MRLWVIGVLVLVTDPAAAGGRSPADYKPYIRDDAPFRKHSRYYQDYNGLIQEAAAGRESRVNLQKRVDIVRRIVDRESRWVDGFWMVAMDAVLLGSTYTDDKDLPVARKYFEVAEDYATRCLRLERHNPLCLFYRGAAIGKKATIDGIFASLSHGEEVLDLWMRAYRSEFNYAFPTGNNLQASVRYALGMYHRLVPDFFLIRMFFGISGDLDKAVTYHQEAITFSRGSVPPCFRIMAAAALFCRDDGAKGDDHRAAVAAIRSAGKGPARSDNDRICQEGGEQLLADPGNGCGYTMARQQDLDESSFREQHGGKAGQGS